MAFFISSSPHAHNRRSTTDLMKWVMLAAIPGLIVQTYYFGWGTVIQLILGLFVASCLEAAVMTFRKRSGKRALQDYSAFVTAWLLAVAIPPLAPWWVICIGLIFSIVVAKQLYGGLGQNPFNPAMIGYVVLLISFPLEMTSWLPPRDFIQEPGSLIDTLSLIFTGFDRDGLSVQQVRLVFDGITMATPLDTIRTSLNAGLTMAETLDKTQFSSFAGIGWQWVNLAYLIGGLALIRARVIQWYIPVAMLVALFVISTLALLFSPGTTASPLIQLFSGATMLGAFFIATDPVTASTTVKGRLIYGAFIGITIFIIRSWGGFPDGVAFAVVIANMCVPLIDYYTKPRTYGH
ncbi:electron transport complex subunit RsxD [Vibrio sp. RC27]